MPPAPRRWGRQGRDPKPRRDRKMDEAGGWPAKEGSGTASGRRHGRGERAGDAEGGSRRGRRASSRGVAVVGGGRDGVGDGAWSRIIRLFVSKGCVLCCHCWNFIGWLQVFEALGPSIGCRSDRWKELGWIRRAARTFAISRAGRDISQIHGEQ